MIKTSNNIVLTTTTTTSTTSNNNNKPIIPPPTTGHEELKRQFNIDAPRVDIILDGIHSHANPDDLLHGIENKFPPKEAIRVIEMCTQAALAPFFSSLREILEDGVHLVDGGRQIIQIDSHKLPHTLCLEKPFKVVDFGNDGNSDARVLFFVTLKLSCNLTTGEICHEWSRTTTVEQDWQLVEEELSEDDELGHGKIATDPLAVAASADRKRQHLPS
jgi:hypothetical protein